MSALHRVFDGSEGAAVGGVVSRADCGLYFRVKSVLRDLLLLTVITSLPRPIPIAFFKRKFLLVT